MQSYKKREYNAVIARIWKDEGKSAAPIAEHEHKQLVEDNLVEAGAGYVAVAVDRRWHPFDNAMARGKGLDYGVIFTRG